MVQVLDVRTPPSRRLVEEDLQSGDAAPVGVLRGIVQRQPGWPVALLFVGYPLWWLLGIPDIVGLIATIAMVHALIKRRSVRLPRGFGLLLLFLAWVILSFLVVQIAAPGAIAAHNVNRYPTASWRLLWYVKAVILLLYLGNERERLSQGWICRTFGWMFVYIVGGGLLGVIAPHLQFSSALEMVLPHGLATTPFVRSNIHIFAAESFADFLGGQYRTSAPFPYANVWGLNFACFAPFFVLGWLGSGASQRRRTVGWLILALGIIPAVLSLNRGLWLALGAIVILVAVRAIFTGRLRVVLWVALGGAIVAAVLALSPLGSTVASRLGGNSDAPSSANTRSDLTSLTLSGVREASPLVGFGATRNVQGNFETIAGGATSSCPRCVVPALGTQGQLLLVVFTQGFVGAVLYFGFLLWQFVRHIAIRSRYATVALGVLLAHFVTSTVYSADNLSILAIFGAVALLWRARIAERNADLAAPALALDETTVADLAAGLRRHWKTMVAIVLVGGLIGGARAYLVGPSYQATASLSVADDPVYPVLQPVPSTLDAVARLASSSAALNAMQRRVGTGARVERSNLTITATANTKIVHITYAGKSAASARAIADAAVSVVLRLRSTELQQQKAEIIAQLDDRTTSLVDALGKVRAAAERAQQPRAALGQERSLDDQVRHNDQRIAVVTNVPLDAGRPIGPTTMKVSRDRQQVDVVNGLGIGLLIAAALLGTALVRTVRVASHSQSVATLPILLRGSAESIDADYLLMRYDPSAVVALDANSAQDVAAALDARISSAARRRRPSRVIVVASSAERTRGLRRLVTGLQRCGAEVLGVIALEPSYAGSEKVTR